MKLEDFINKRIILELKDGEIVDGILTEVNDIDDDVNSLYYTTLNIRLDLDDYRIVYLTEIDNISEVL